MTFLELCKRLRQEASVSGDGPSSTLNQSGEMLRLVNWIGTAYEEIQNMKDNWRFMTSDFSFNTINGQNEYLAATSGISDLASWKPDSFRIYKTSLGVMDEQWIRYLEYEERFRDLRGFANTSMIAGRPIDFSIKPDNALVLFPIPDDTTYTIRGQYYKTPSVMTLDIDTPNFPQRFHMAIVWKALMYYGMYESAQEMIAQGERNFNQVYARLSIDQSFKPRIASGSRYC